MPTAPRTLLAAIGLTLVVATGCTADDGADSAGGLPVLDGDAGHVHGMALNPADDLLYLGTHAGTMVLDGGEISRVGESTIDLMGFAAAGPDHFYASGHPGPDDDLPDPVGLIESTDGGVTWQPLSLTGEVDFHTLGAAGDAIYGFGGQLLTSDGGTEWTAGAADVAPASLAVDPDDGDRVVATTEHGPARSTDGAQTFAHLEGAPMLLFVAWPAPDRLWGIGLDGQVHLSQDGGDTWQTRGKVDPPVAFTAGADGRVAVATEDELLLSEDGETFEPVAELAGGGH